ncbi:MAG: hypothetical protein R3C19_19785 [Planctomycetaceae bacterium]
MSSDEYPRWSSAAMAVVSVWLIYHISAVVIAAASIPPSSTSVQSTWRFFAPYLQGLNLNHGFHYFAPNPGASSMIAWSAERSDGTTDDGRFPSVDIQPRLLYHRYFMLSENLSSVSEEMRTELIRSYGRCLCRRKSASEVTLSRIVHLIPTVEYVQDGGGLEASESYLEEPLETVTCEN